ncbi:hypothetical protein CR513_40460, partial [Mucuna pruriens]
MVEYEACAMGITMAIEHQDKTLRVFSDSALVIYQLRALKLIPYRNHIMEISEFFDKITFHYVPRDDNQMADALATLSSMLQVNQGQIMTIHVWHQVKMAHCQHEPTHLGATKNEKRRLRRLAASFFLSGAILYKRSADLTLLRCIVDWEAKEIMKEVHEGALWTYANNHALARKIL